MWIKTVKPSIIIFLTFLVLLEWMFQQDAEKLMKKYNNIDVWEQGFMELLCYIKKK